MTLSIHIRFAAHDDLEQLVSLDKTEWGEEMAGTKDMFASRIECFPEGQVVASIDDTVVGFMNSQQIDDINPKARYTDEATWPLMTDEGTIQTTHNPYGDVLFLINLTVVKNDYFRRAEVGAYLVSYMKQLARERELARIEGITRVNGFASYLRKNHAYDQLPAEERQKIEAERIHPYLTTVINGTDKAIRDPALQFHLAQGATVVGPVRGAMPGDYASLLWGASFIYAPEMFRQEKVPLK